MVEFVLMAAAIEGSYIVLQIKITHRRGRRDSNIIVEDRTTTIFQKLAELHINNGNTSRAATMTTYMCNLEWFSLIVQLDILH